MTRCIALLRGINVGRAKRVPMKDLRALMEELGHSGVRTLLNSGNVVFDAARADTGRLARGIEQAIEARFGFPVPVSVVTAAQLDAVAAANPLPQAGANPSRFLVAFAADEHVLARVRPLLAEPWEPDAFAVGERAAYLWCQDGVLDSPLMRAFARAAGDGVTSRNWATVRRIVEAASVDAGA